MAPKIQRGNRENVVKVRYTHPSSKASPGQSPGRAVRYLTRRPEQGQEATREADWNSLPDDQILGSPEAFKTAATERTREIRERYEPGGDKEGKDLSRVKGDKATWCTGYLHIVISPEGREDYTPEDFAAHAEPWIDDAEGGEAPWFAAIHYDDPEGPKMHLCVARDRFAADDFQGRLDQADEITEERKQVIEEERRAQAELEEAARQREERDRQRKEERQRQEERRDDGLSI